MIRCIRHKATPSRASRASRSAVALACLVAWATAATAAGTVYRWVDSSGVTHLSSDRPPAGVAYERVAIASSSRAKTAKGNVRLASVSPEQLARRKAVVTELQNRECVVALEAIDRLAHRGQAVEPNEYRRLQQTADLNCSRDPATRRGQEEQAARLRVAKGDVCVDARNQLARMLEPGRRPAREQLRIQQEFIDAHCKAPVR
jgi:Domain of unknown function (DUF4124)